MFFIMPKHACFDTQRLKEENSQARYMTSLRKIYDQYCEGI